MSSILQEVWEDVEDYLTKKQIFFFNERDLQVKLAKYLSDLHEADTLKYSVHLEYHIPKSVLPRNGSGYKWSEDTLSIDLVVERNGKFVPIELKYKTRSIDKSAQIDRFGKSIAASSIIKNQSAQDIGRYSFWKDVRRLELLKEGFDNIVGGIALIVTNDKSYKTNPSSSAVGYYDFRILPGKNIGPHLSWRDRNGNPIQWEVQPRPNFELGKNYNVRKWRSYKSKADFGEHEMYYNFILVK